MKRTALFTLVSAFVFVAIGLTYAGDITGTITYNGTAPAREKLNATKDKHCVDTVGGTMSEVLVVSKGKGIKNVVIYLRRVRGAEPTVPAKNPVLDQIGCKYVPHVLAVVAGTTVDISSSDPVAHNVHSHAKEDPDAAVNWQIPQPGKALPLKLAKPEAIKFTCDVHNWMSGYVVVVENDHYAVTGYKGKDGKWLSSDDYEKSDDKGTFAIKGVPAGKYRLQAWHEVLGTANQTVEVAASGAVSVNLTNGDFETK